MIIDDTYDCYILDADEDDTWFSSKSCITLHSILFIKEVSLNDEYNKVTEITYNDGTFIYIKESVVIFRNSWKKFKRSINLYSIN